VKPICNKAADFSTHHPHHLPQAGTITFWLRSHGGGMVAHVSLSMKESSTGPACFQWEPGGTYAHQVKVESYKEFAA
jgi:hypothetical protein